MRKCYKRRTNFSETVFKKQTFLYLFNEDENAYFLYYNDDLLSNYPFIRLSITEFDAYYMDVNMYRNTQIDKLL